jgi:hypothetical protein|nr:MAG TPA: hypothetical protein [Caudoviricetes sp.]
MDKEQILLEIEELKKHCQALQEKIEELSKSGNQGAAMYAIDDLQEAESLMSVKKALLEETK